MVYVKGRRYEDIQKPDGAVIRQHWPCDWAYTGSYDKHWWVDVTGEWNAFSGE